MSGMFFQVGKVIVQTTAKQLPKLLTRFRGAKQIKNPTGAQMDNAGKITGNFSNFTKAEKKILKSADTARPTIMQSLTGTGRTGAQETAKKGLKGTGESRRSFTKGVTSGSAITATVGAGGKLVYDLTTGKTGGKTPKGADPKGLMKPKKKVEQPKKKPNIPPKAPPSKPKSIKKKTEDSKKKTTQLYMKEKRTGKDSNVKFNSRGGMLKKGKK